jgi:hypothetical protein
VHDHAVDGRDSIGFGRKWLAHIDEHRGGDRHRSVGAGITGERGLHRPAVAQRQCHARERLAHYEIGRKHMANRLFESGGALGNRIHQCTDAREHIGKRCEPADALR